VTSEWESLAEWWVGEVASDPAYRHSVLPLTEALCPDNGLILELGCGEGQVIRYLARDGRTLVGLEPNPILAAVAAAGAPVFRARMPDLRCIRPEVFDGALLVLVLEHLDPVAPSLAAIRRVVRPGGSLSAVLNHPALTAPGAAAVVDPRDGEEFWRWGSYLEPGYTTEPAGAEVVTFFHRSMSDVLTAAAGAGWDLEEAIEMGWSDDTTGPPRLLGLRWRRGSDPAMIGTLA
jgi:SAM-dependent methyltransferase